jgi:MarR family transcriptional regulator, 2-MHQ and catechol-resistance regulon repressor
MPNPLDIFMSSAFPGSPDEMIALSTFVKLMRAGESVMMRVHRHLDDYGLTISQFGVLDAIFHIGSMSQKDLAQKLLKSGGNLTMVIDNLEKRGLVKRIRSAVDRRVINVSLTEAGEALIRQIFPKHVAIIKQEFSILTSAQQIELGDLCRIVGKQE